LDVGVGGLGDVDIEPSGSDDLVVLAEDGGADDDDDPADLMTVRMRWRLLKGAADCFSKPFTAARSSGCLWLRTSSVVG
jgi:hypothetical protein